MRTLHALPLLVCLAFAMHAFAIITPPEEEEAQLATANEMAANAAGEFKRLPGKGDVGEGDNCDLAQEVVKQQQEIASNLCDGHTHEVKETATKIKEKDSRIKELGNKLKKKSTTKTAVAQVPEGTEIETEQELNEQALLKKVAEKDAKISKLQADLKKQVRPSSPIANDLPYNLTAWSKHPSGRVYNTYGPCKTGLTPNLLTPEQATQCKGQGGLKRDVLCTSCYTHKIFQPVFANIKTGRCNAWPKLVYKKLLPSETIKGKMTTTSAQEHLHVHVEPSQTRCTALDICAGTVAPDVKNIICVKWGLARDVWKFWSLNDREAKRHFRPMLGDWSRVEARCRWSKQTACRNGECAVKKEVKCIEVCKFSQHSLRTKCSRKLCKGRFGALACRFTAMMS